MWEKRPLHGKVREQDEAAKARNNKESLAAPEGAKEGT
jgi:hypothetical protein